MNYLNILDINYLSDVICIYFPQFHRLPFHFVDDFPWSAEAFKFDVFSLVIFALVVFALVSDPENHWQDKFQGDFPYFFF